MKRLFIALAAGGLAALLAGCAGVHQFVKPGTPRDEIISRLGPPTGGCTLPMGERLQYSLQPSGPQIYNLDLDAQGRLVKLEQVLEPELFSRIQVDVWTTAEVLCMYGKPAKVERVARFEGDIWSYLFTQNYWDWLVSIHLDRSGVVRMVTKTEARPRGSHH